MTDRQRGMQAIQTARYVRRWYFGIDVLPYQLSVGITVRRLDGWNARLYVGPIKMYGGRINE